MNFIDEEEIIQDSNNLKLLKEQIQKSFMEKFASQLEILMVNSQQPLP